MNLQVEQIIPSRPTKSGKMTPIKIKFNNGIEAVLGKGVELSDFTVGAFGEAEIESKQDGQYTNHRVLSWSQTKPAGERPAADFSDNNHAVDQAVWDAKGRGTDAQSAAKSAAVIVAAMVTAGQLKEHDEVTAAYDMLMNAGYEFFQLARADKIATSANPFPDTPGSKSTVKVV